MKNLIVLFLLTFSIDVCGQGRTFLSLAEAIDYAMGHNLTLLNAQIDVEKSNKKIWETTASGLPQISLSGQWQHTITDIPEISFMPGQTATLGVRNNLTAGGKLEQLIFNGSYLVGVQSSKLYRSLATLGVEKGEIEIGASVSQAYYVSLLSRESVVIINENIVLLNKTLNEMRKTNAQGFIDRTSVDRIEVAYNQLLAQRNSLDRQVVNSLDLLKYLIGMELSEQVELTDHLTDILSTIPTFYYDLNYYNPDLHIDIRMAEIQVEVSNQIKKLYQSEWLPSLGAQLVYQHNFTLPDFSFQRAANAYLGVGLNVPIFKSGATRAKVNQAKLAIQQSINTEKLKRLELDLEFNNAHSEFQLSWDNFTLQRQNMALAAKVLRDTQISLNQGVSSSNDLVQSNNSYLEAVRSYLSSQLNLLNSKLRLDKVLSN